MDIATRISSGNRDRKWRLFLEAVKPTSSTTVLNVGYNNNEYSPVDNYLEKHYPYRANITALGIQAPSEYARRYPEVRVVTYDGIDFPFPDKSFDVCWSNAVLEHVGTAARQLHFVREIVRVSRMAFVTTPNRYFPIEVHTRTPLLHFLPKRAFDAYLRRIGKPWATGTYMNLLGAGDLQRIVKNSGCISSRIVRNRFLGFALDFVVLLECGAVPTLRRA